MTLSTNNIETHLGRLVETDGTKFIRDLLADRALVDKLSLDSDIKMNVEELKSSGGKLLVRGWAFIEDGHGSRDSKTFIIAKYGPAFRLIKAGAVTRKDLTKHFEARSITTRRVLCRDKCLQESFRVSAFSSGAGRRYPLGLSKTIG
jgi:hypothetical protein